MEATNQTDLLNDPASIADLWDELETNADLFGPHHARTLAVVHRLAIALWQADDVEGAATLLSQALYCLTSTFGANHAATLTAKGDLSAILFELGHDEKAEALELEALESARAHLGKTHPVTCVLAWNRALNYQRYGNSAAAKETIRNDLTWLLTEDPAALEDDQRIIRGMLAERLNWDNASTC